MMKQSFKNGLALRLAGKLSARGRELRRELRDHYRQEFARIRLAERRARGLRLYVAWSRSPDAAPERRSVHAWRSLESAV